METDTSKKEARQPSRAKATALKFVLLIGVMSFFADFTCEGSRSIIGPYLAVLGASAAAVGIVTGFGELLGYGLRLVSGRLSDQTGKSVLPISGPIGSNIGAFRLFSKGSDGRERSSGFNTAW